MNKYIFRQRRQQHPNQQINPTPEPIHSRRVLLALFGRFGAICQALTVAREAALKHPEIEWLVICSPQLHPYCQSLLPHAHEIINVGRNDLFGLFLANRAIRQFRPELGLNPWGHGIDSEFFASQAVTYRPFNRFWQEYYANLTNIDAINHGNFFNMLRSYFGLAPVAAPDRTSTGFPSARQILVCPESSEAKRTLSPAVMQKLLRQLHMQFGMECEIWLAASNRSYDSLAGIKKFIPLKKSKGSSASFINAINQSELMLAVDSGPMNIATALAIPTIAIFSSEAPERVIDFAQYPLVLRDPLMAGKSCQNRQCQEPLCMNQMITTGKLFEPCNIWRPAKTVTTSDAGCIWQKANFQPNMPTP